MNDLTADEQTADEHPILLRFRHRSPSLTSKSASLGSTSRGLSSSPPLFLEIHPEDATRLGIKNGDCIVASAQTVTIRAVARINPRISAGTALVATSDLTSESSPLTSDPTGQMRSPNITQIVIRPA